MRGLDFHKNVHVSGTKLMLGIRVGFISSQLSADKLFPVNPRVITGPPKMSLQLEVKSTPALIIKPMLILVAQVDDLGWYITFNQQGQMFVQKRNRIVSKPNVKPRQILYCTKDCVPIEWCFTKTLILTQVWNRVSHRNYCRQRGVIRVIYGCYNSDPY